jgi:predicted XRE-type DNA-binding protein
MIDVSHIQNLEEYIQAQSQRIPVLGKTYQPWRNHGADKLVLDHMGCICTFYLEQRYNRPDVDYSFDQAISDGYIAIDKAIKRDMMAPTVMPRGKITNHKCKHCGEKFQIKGFDAKPSLTMIGGSKGPIYMNDEQAHHICNNSDQVIVWREFEIECPHCNHIEIKKIHKAQFASVVFNMARGEIQSGARQTAGKQGPLYENKGPYDTSGRRAIVSLDAPQSEGVNLANTIESRKEHHSLSEETMDKISTALMSLPIKQREIICRVYGFEFDGSKLDPMNKTECAEMLGITKQRVSQVCKTATDRMGAFFNINDEPEY